jgi:hypothetical protein
MSKKPKNIEHYERRFGIIVIEKGYVTNDQVINTLAIQVGENIEHGIHRQIGEILLSLNVMNANQIEDVVKSIFKKGKS